MSARMQETGETLVVGTLPSMNGYIYGSEPVIYPGQGSSLFL